MIAENRIEAELAGFEKLLTEVMMFKNNSSSWSRNERLAYTQNFVDAFGELIGDNDGAEAENSSDDEPTVPTTVAKPD